MNLSTIITPDLIERAKDLGAFNKDILWLEEKPRTIKDALARSACWTLEMIPETQDNREIVFEAVKRNGWALSLTSERLRDDKEIVLEAVKQDGDTLYFASERLRDDKEIVLAARENYFWALDYASERLQKELQDANPQLQDF